MKRQFSLYNWPVSSWVQKLCNHPRIEWIDCVMNKKKKKGNDCDLFPKIQQVYKFYIQHLHTAQTELQCLKFERGCFWHLHLNTQARDIAGLELQLPKHSLFVFQRVVLHLNLATSLCLAQIVLLIGTSAPVGSVGCSQLSTYCLLFLRRDSFETFQRIYFLIGTEFMGGHVPLNFWTDGDIISFVSPTFCDKK